MREIYLIKIFNKKHENFLKITWTCFKIYEDVLNYMNILKNAHKNFEHIFQKKNAGTLCKYYEHFQMWEDFFLHEKYLEKCMNNFQSIWYFF